MGLERTSLELIAPDLETAIERAQSELGVPAEDLEVEVLDERDTDAGHEVYVRFLLHGNELRPGGADEVTAAARQIVSELLGHMEIDAEVQVYYLGANSGEADTTLQVDLEGEDLALLIGRKGETLDALQSVSYTHLTLPTILLV